MPTKLFVWICGGIGRSKTKPLIGTAIKQTLVDDRTHRTGQKKPVDVVRIIVKNSVEERILALQEQKKTLAATALGDEAAGRIGRLTVHELIGLFGTITKDREGNIRVE